MKVLLLAAVLASSTIPGPVVERTVERGETTVRLTLFDNRVAVVSLREPGEEPRIRRRTLDPEEYVGYLAAFNRDAAELRQKGRSAPETVPPGQRCRVALSVGGEALVLEYSTMRVPSLALGRLGAALDDLETYVLATPEGFDELTRWTPSVGDRVALRRGGTAAVAEVREDGTVVLRHERVALLEVVPPASRADFIERLLEPDR